MMVLFMLFTEMRDTSIMNMLHRESWILFRAQEAESN